MLGEDTRLHIAGPQALNLLIDPWQPFPAGDHAPQHIRSNGCVMTRLHTPRWAWALTGSGHFFVESFELISTLEHCDVFVLKAANEVLRMYKLKLEFPETTRVLHDKTASSVPVGGFYTGVYHTAVIAPATSNTVAKCVAGISNLLPTNVLRKRENA